MHLWWTTFTAHASLNANNAILAELTKVDGVFPFQPALLALAIELCKFGITLVLAIAEKTSTYPRPLHRVLTEVFASGFRDIAVYAIPAVLYAISNNGAILLFLYLSPQEVMLIGQLRVVFTVLLTSFFFRKTYSWQQWGCLLLLISAILQLQGFGCQSLPTCATETKDDTVNRDWNDKAMGFGINLVVCFTSAAASVYSQRLLTTPESINVSNLKLYFFGVCWTLLAVVITSTSDNTSNDHGHSHGHDHDHDQNFTSAGINTWGYAYILNMTACGLVISRLLKHAGAVVKLFSQATSICLVVVFSYVLELKQHASITTSVLAMINVFVSLFIFISNEELTLSASIKQTATSQS
eukprot:m.191831 g.191831  ORF g.191831 m.191831 type:complete len:354 (+) comp32446_c1_seq2:237-1298(+)